ncbi:MAG: AraC family transcriptional regulator [Solobacterium sp.]|nr:AraC family transcriptional regulator [Solobacterium sp.]
MNSLFQNDYVKSDRTIYTASSFAKSSLFYLQETGTLTSLRPHVSRRDNLNSFLFMIVISGSGTLSYGNTYPMHAGDCAFIDCRFPYEHETDSVDLWTLKWIHFCGNNATNIYEKYTERGGSPVFAAGHPDTYTALLDEIHALAKSEDYIRDMRINEKISSLLTCLMEESWHPENSMRAGLKKQSLHEVKDWLDHNWQKNTSLDDLSARFFINKFYLSKTFKKQFGISISVYQTQLKITEAKRMLRFTDLSAYEIAKQCGYEDPAYFTRVFARVEGISPGEYRKKWQPVL